MLRSILYLSLLVVGPVVTIAVVVGDMAHWFDPWEHQTIDWRFQSPFRPADPMSDQIRFVDIDEASLDLVGNWPWDRAKLAGAIDEMRRAGAKTIALDLILTDVQTFPSASVCDPNAPSEETGDERLARAIGGDETGDGLGKCVLGVVLPGDPFGEAWASTLGQADRDELLDALGADIEMDVETASSYIRDRELKARFNLRTLEFKWAAAWRKLQRVREKPLVRETAAGEITKGEDGSEPDYPANQILDAVVDQVNAWHNMKERGYLLPRRTAPPSAIGIPPANSGGEASPENMTELDFGWHRDRAPLKVFADAAKSIGFVSFGQTRVRSGEAWESAANAVVRDIEILRPAPRGSAVQLGIAAAALHADDTLDADSIREGVVVVTVPDEDAGTSSHDVILRERDGGRLWIYWPRGARRPDGESVPPWRELLRREGDDHLGVPGHLALHSFVRLAEVRALQECDKQDLLALAQFYLAVSPDNVRSKEIRDRVVATAKWEDPEDSDARAEWLEYEEAIDPTVLVDFLDLAQWYLGEQVTFDMLESGEIPERVVATSKWNDPESSDARDEWLEYEKSIDQTDLIDFIDLAQWYLNDELTLDNVRTNEVREKVVATATWNDAVHSERHNLWLAYEKSLDATDPLIADLEDRLSKSIKGKLVFVGWTATGTVADFVQTPVGGQTPGVVVHAAIANMILNDRAVSFPARWIELVIPLLVGLFCSFAAARYSILPSALLAGIPLAIYLALSFHWLFIREGHLVLPLVTPFTAGAGSWVAVTALQTALLRQDRSRITRQFKARVSGQLVDQLVDNPGAISVSGEEREITVLFADMKGFTTISEQIGGEASVATLNRYMGAFTRALIAQDAYVNKFLGDGVMAFWSAFAPDADQAEKACRAALACLEAAERINHDSDLADVPDITMRIGIATGKLVVGDCGAPPDLHDYTVIGDAANLAARLESANKKFGTQIVMNGRTRELVDERCKEPPGPFRALGRIGVVGQDKPTEVFHLFWAEAPDAPDDPEEFIALTEKAVAAYRGGEFPAAAAAFAELEERYGRSPLIDNYRDALQEVPAQPFDGVLRLRDK